MSSLIGVDLGGTNLRAAQVYPTGEIGVTRQEPVDHDPRANHPDAPPFGQLVAVVSDVIADIAPSGDEVLGVGVAVTGPVDPITGWVANPFTLPAAMQGDLFGALRTAFDLPIAVDNDANAAALGEALFGAGRGGELVVCITIGTGIGVGVVQHGRINEGAGRAHPEPGHLVVDPSGPDCYCGASGCIESLASASAIVAAAQTAGLVDDAGSARDVHVLASNGHEGAHRIIARAEAALAAGVRTLVAVYAPDVVVLAGNAQGDPARLVNVVTDTIEPFPFGAPNVTVRTGTLGNWAGCIGAASLSMK